MKKEYKLRLTGQDYQSLKAHLFPGDGKEAAAIALCGRAVSPDYIQLLVHELVLIPYDECSIRASNLIKWSTLKLVPLLEKAERDHLSILKIHSHPTWYNSFSSIDDKADKELFSSVYGWVNDDGPHASAVMLPDGSIFARFILDDLSFISVDKIITTGDDINVFTPPSKQSTVNEYNLRNAQAFGEGTTSILRKLRIGIVGCSGTGSIIAEQLLRMNIGELVLVDPESVENVNVNRILYSTVSDAKSKILKVDLLKRAFDATGLDTHVITVNKNLYDGKEVVQILSTCDIVFGTMDSIDGRHLLNRISTFYLLPYFDVGVKLISDGKGGIEKIIGVLHYLQPGKSSLFTRGVYSIEELRSATLRRTSPEFYEEQKKNKYIADIDVPSPAVISVNMQTSSLAMNDFLARIHPFRYSSNKLFAMSGFDITDWTLFHDGEGVPDKLLQGYKGRGDMTRMLDMDW